MCTREIEPTVSRFLNVHGKFSRSPYFFWLSTWVRSPKKIRLSPRGYLRGCGPLLSEKQYTLVICAYLLLTYFVHHGVIAGRRGPSRPPPRASVNLVPLLLTGVRLHPPGRTDEILCRCFGAPARRVFPDHLIT